MLSIALHQPASLLDDYNWFSHCGRSLHWWATAWEYVDGPAPQFGKDVNHEPIEFWGAWVRNRGLLQSAQHIGQAQSEVDQHSSAWSSPGAEKVIIMAGPPAEVIDGKVSM